MEADITSQAVGLSSTDFSIIKLFLRADIIVKSVIILLIAASIYSWAIIFEKYKGFSPISSRAKKSVFIFRSYSAIANIPSR